MIIGANSAGISAALSARKADLRAEIILISDEAYWPYSRCGLPYVLSEEIASFNELTFFSPSYYRMMKLDFRAKTIAKGVDAQNKTLQVATTENEQEEIEYDSLILCTGALPFIPTIQGVNKRGLFTLRGINDGMKIMNWMKMANSAIVIGAGFIGLELASVFTKQGIKTIVIERCPNILPQWFDKDMADLVQEKMEHKGVDVIVGKNVKKILGKESVTGVCAQGEEFEADTVLVATGVKARIELAKQMRLKLGETGAVKVNSRMETSLPGVYAAGDCAECYHMITGEPTLSPLGTNAGRQGKIAGINAAGGYAVFPGVLHSVVSSIFNFEIGATGFTEAFAQRKGWMTVSGTITSKTKAEYYPGGRNITIKVVIETDLGKIVGGQVIGGEDVTQRVNMISIAIQNQICASELSKADTCYAPSVCSPWEPLILAAENAAIKLRRF